jgi:hypothetical protein
MTMDNLLFIWFDSCYGRNPGLQTFHYLKHGVWFSMATVSLLFSNTSLCLFLVEPFRLFSFPCRTDVPSIVPAREMRTLHYIAWLHIVSFFTSGMWYAIQPFSFFSYCRDLKLNKDNFPNTASGKISFSFLSDGECLFSSCMLTLSPFLLTFSVIIL